MNLIILIPLWNTVSTFYTNNNIIRDDINSQNFAKIFYQLQL